MSHTWSSDDELTPQEAAAELHCTEGTLAVWRSTKRHELPYIKYPSCIRYLRSDVESFKAARRIAT